MKIMGIVQPLDVTSGYIDGHWELPLGHRRVELWAEGRIRLDSPTWDISASYFVQSTSLEWA